MHIIFFKCAVEVILAKKLIIYGSKACFRLIAAEILQILTPTASKSVVICLSYHKNNILTIVMIVRYAIFKTP